MIWATHLGAEVSTLCRCILLLRVRHCHIHGAEGSKVGNCCVDICFESPVAGKCGDLPDASRKKALPQTAHVDDAGPSTSLACAFTTNTMRQQIHSSIPTIEQLPSHCSACWIVRVVSSKLWSESRSKTQGGKSNCSKQRGRSGNCPTHDRTRM